MSLPADLHHVLVTAGLVILYGVAIHNCIRVVGDRVSPGAAFAWIFVNLSVPLVGVPLYILLGNHRIRGYVKRHKAGVKTLERVEPPTNLAPAVDPTDLPADIRGRADSLHSLFRPFAAEPLYDLQYGTCDLLIDGKDTFEAIFAAIANAKRYILVQYYIVRSDRLGLELQRLLIEKARAGVPVYLLYDDMGSFWLSRHYLNALRAAGVRVARFLPVGGLKRPFQLNFRNHRKLVVVDGEQAFTGGLNVGEEYATRRQRRRLRKQAQRGPQRVYWRDTHARIAGGLVGRMEDLFLEDWFFATDEVVHIPSPPPPAEKTTTALQLIPTGPTDDVVISIFFLMHLINSAKKRLWISTPYFVPDASLMRALELAAMRGVDVRIILPKVSDNALVHWVSLLYAEILQTRGVVVLLYEVGFMHQKVILVDDDTAVVGTMNLDNRALYFNFEMMVLIIGQDFAAREEAMLKRDFVSCRFLSQDRNRYLRHLKRWRANAVRLLAPLL